MTAAPADFAFPSLFASRGLNVLDLSAEDSLDLSEQPFLAAGLIDVTAAPFSADPGGRVDSTRALRRAVEFGRYHKLGLWFPMGEYLVTDTIRCITGWSDERTPELLYLPFCELWPSVLIGERCGGRRPVIRLAPASRGFHGGELKPVVEFVARRWERKEPYVLDEGFEGATGMNALLYGIDVEVGEGNPGAVAVSFDQAEGSTIQDCTIRAGDAAVGLRNCPGCGASVYNLTIEGGRIGGLFDSYRPVPSMVGCRFRGQREQAIFYKQRGSLSLIGCHFELRSGALLLEGANPEWGAPNSVNLVDCQIECDARPGTVPLLLLDTAATLRNTWVRGANLLVRAAAGEIRTPSEGWVRIEEVAVAHQVETERVSCSCSNYRDLEQEAPLVHRMQSVAEGPPADLCSQHILWDAAEFPQWNQEGISNVKSDFGAIGDGVADDTQALQHAIDHGAPVFLPAGCYRISRSLRLHPGTRLFGIHQCYSLIVPSHGGESDFGDMQDPRPVLQTANESDARTQLAFLGVFMPREEARAAYPLDWQCGGRSFIRCLFSFTGYTANDLVPLAKGLRPWLPWKWDDVRELSALTGPVAHDNACLHGKSSFEEPAAEPLTIGAPDWPLFRVSGHGGGAWYPFMALDGRPHGVHHRRILIEKIQGPFRIYHAHLQYARGEAEAEIVDSRNVAIYGCKNEGGPPILLIRRSQDILCTGLGGVRYPLDGRGFFEIHDSERITLCGLTINFWRRTAASSFMVEVSRPEGAFRTPPREFPSNFVLEGKPGDESL